MIAWLGSLIGGPLIRAALEAYRAKLQNGSKVDVIRGELAAREVELQMQELRLQTQYRIAELGHWWEPDKLMGYVVAIYFGKLIIWDKVLGLGITDPLTGWAASTATLIVGFYFGKRGIENVVRILKR